MMRFQVLISFILVGCAFSGPARRDCGQEKCYDAVNECGMTYGGCWTECADGPTEMPTFTAPLCVSNTDAEHPTQSRDATAVLTLTTTGPAGSLITPPPSLDITTTSIFTRSSSCVALWLCVDYLAVCGDLTQMYGGCYDICTSSPPVTSPPCSLSSSTTDIRSAVATPTPETGAAYTETPAIDKIGPAVDNNNKALVMAEMPNTDVSTPATVSEAGFRLASSNSAETATSPTTENSSLVEAPANLRGAAIAKMEADTVRRPNTDNVPCWDKATCREVQLGIPSPLSSQLLATSSAAPQ